jgi:hypothetical protein
LGTQDYITKPPKKREMLALLSGGRVIIPLSGGACSLRIEMATAQPRG